MFTIFQLLLLVFSVLKIIDIIIYLEKFNAIISNILIFDFFLNKLFLSDSILCFISILHFIYYLHFLINKYNYLFYYNNFFNFSYISILFLLIGILEDNDYKLYNNIYLYFLNDINFFDSFYYDILKIIILFLLFVFFFFIKKNIILKIINNNGLIITLIWFLVMTLFFIISNNNILDILLLLELQTFISLILYFLLTNKKYNINEILKLEASIKYFLMSALGSIFIILGCACVYFFFDTFNLIFIKDILYLKFDDINYNYNSNLIFFIIIIGLFIKLGIAPFHQWSLDVVLGLPYILLFYFFVFPKIVFFILIFKVYNIFFNDYNFINFEFFFIIIIFINLLLSSINAIFDTRLKRIIVFSNMSSTVTFIISLLLNNNTFFETIMVYIIVSMFLYTCLIYICNLLKLKININKKKLYYKFEISNIDQFSNLIYIYPIISIILTFILFSLIGLPPFLGFFIKLNIIFNFTLFSHNILFIIIYFLLTLYISFYYLKIIRSLNITKYQYYYILYNNIDRKTSYLSIIFFFINFYFSIVLYSYIFVNLNLTYFLI